MRSLICGLALLVCLLASLSVQAQINFEPATTVQLPVFGVSVDADGVLQHIQFAPAGGQLFVERARAAIAKMDQDLVRSSKLRKISLKRLQETIKQHLDQQTPLPDEILKLAGLQRIEYVFAYPDQKDIVIAGPAEGWLENSDGRAVSINSGRAVVLLEDLVTALRIFSTNEAVNNWVGCTIGSTPEGRRRLSELQREIPRRIETQYKAEFARTIIPAIEEALGNASVAVFGIPEGSNMANVMLEADYRMKLIAIGREPPPVRMPTFMEKLRGAPKDNFQRWWFTPNYQCVAKTGDGLGFQMVGQGVRLGTEEYKQDGKGGVIAVPHKPMRAARLYAESFTEKYEEIAVASAVFGQLRNMVDLLIVANYMQREDLLRQTELDLSLLLDNDRLPADTRPVPTAAKCLANAAWKSTKLVAPSGGVSVLPAEALRISNLLDASKYNIAENRDQALSKADQNHWWWD